MNADCVLLQPYQHKERHAPQGVAAVIVEDVDEGPEEADRSTPTSLGEGSEGKSEAAGERASTWAQDVGRTAVRRSPATPVISENLTQQRQRSLQYLLNFASQRSSVQSVPSVTQSHTADMADTDREDTGNVSIVSSRVAELGWNNPALSSCTNRPATANPAVRVPSPANRPLQDNFNAESVAFSGGGGGGACRSGSELRPSTAAPAGRAVPPAVSSVR